MVMVVWGVNAYAVLVTFRFSYATRLSRSLEHLKSAVYVWNLKLKNLWEGTNDTKKRAETVPLKTQKTPSM